MRFRKVPHAYRLTWSHWHPLATVWVSFYALNLRACRDATNWQLRLIQ